MSAKQEHRAAAASPDWLAEHLGALRKRLDKLRMVEAAPGKGGAQKAKEAAEKADRLERRLARLMRLDQQRVAHDARVRAADRERARRLARSRNPRDRAQVVIGAALELPIDLALEVGEEILRQVRSRAGGDDDTPNTRPSDTGAGG